jgi:transcriptional regulator with PAS, ATPase and Fis domain
LHCNGIGLYINTYDVSAKENLKMIKHVETQLLDELEKYTWPCSVKEINNVMVKKNTAKDLLSILEISYRNKVSEKSLYLSKA